MPKCRGQKACDEVLLRLGLKEEGKSDEVVLALSGVHYDANAFEPPPCGPQLVDEKTAQNIQEVYQYMEAGNYWAYSIPGTVNRRQSQFETQGEFQLGNPFFSALLG